MAICPNCQSTLDEDFGLVECSVCGLNVFIELDGEIRINQDEVESFAGEPDESASTSTISQPDYLTPESESESTSSFDSEDDMVSATSEVEASFGDTEVIQESHDDILDKDFEAPGAEVDFGRTEDSQNEVDIQDSSEAFGFADLENFANAEVSSADEGLLKYELCLRGIDTTDLRVALREAMTDKRFVWDTEAMIRQIEEGVLVLSDLSAAKAHLLVTRLLDLPIEVEWKQRAIHIS